MWGGAGADTFKLYSGGGGVYIHDLQWDDVLNLQSTAFDFTSMARVNARASEDASGTTIDLGGGDFVKLVGTHEYELDVSDFVL